MIKLFNLRFCRTQRILTSKLFFIENKKEHVILKLLPFQQNGNELTVPNNYK